MTTFKDLHIFLETLRTDALYERVPAIVAKSTIGFLKNALIKKSGNALPMKL